MPTYTMPSLSGLDLSKLDLSKVKLPKFDVSKVQLPKFELPKFDMPTVELPKFDMPKIDMPKVELPQIDVDRLGDLARDAAYASVGLVVLTVEKFAERRRDLQAKVTTRARQVADAVA